MKVISLNTWGGRGGVQKLLTFFREHADVDVFCLQEVWNGGEEMVGKIGGGVPLLGVDTTLLQNIAETLPQHTYFFRPHFHDFYGLALFVKKDLSVLGEQEYGIYKDAGYVSEDDIGDHARILQAVSLGSDNPVSIIHTHGLWQRTKTGKQDNPDRILQSERIVEFTENVTTPFILVGDFNILPTSESVAILERAGMRNLISEYGITSTRTSHYTKPEKFADYAFVSEGIIVNDFRVLPDEVSDHAPLYLDFSLS